MSYGNNNSRNIANLLRYQPLEPIQPRRNPNPIQPEPLLPSRARQEIPFEDVFTPEEGIDKRSFRRKTPMSSGNGGEGSLRGYERNEDGQLQSLRVRLQQIVKFYDQRHRNLENNLSERLNGLQNLVMRQMPKVDNASLLRGDVSSFKQVIKDIRKQLQYQTQELTVLRARQEQRGNQLALANDPKQKQKLTILFLQIARVANEVEKIQSGMGSVGRNYESRIQQIEFKLSNSQKNLGLLAQRNTNGNQLLSQFGDKVMERLQTAQNNLLILGKQRVKDKEMINQLTIQNQRFGEDMQVLLRNMQGDFQNKLQNRISETINRLLSEHEERVNAQEQIRRNLDMRERMNQQKQNNDKQQFRSRYENMDALVRNQFQKKDDSIRMLQNMLQNEVKNMQKLIYDEGSNRRQQEGVLRNEIKRIQENFRQEYDIFKTHQSDVLEKIGQLVKEEVQVRVASEINLKKLTSDIANQLVNDLNSVKEAISTSNKKLNLSIKEVANDSSQRAGQLSHYVDQEVKKVVEVVTEKYSKMKVVFTKLAQQLKEHLTNTEANRQNIEKRLSRLEDNFEILKTDVSGEIDEFYEDLNARLKQEKQYVETFIFKKNNDLTIRVNKLEQYTNQYFELLKGNIEENKEILSNKLQNNNTDVRSPESEEEMKELRTIVFNVRSLTEQLKNQNRAVLERFRDELKHKQTQNRRKDAEKENQMQQKIDKNSASIKEVEDKQNELSVKVNSLRAQSGSDNNINNDRVKRLSDQIDAINTKIQKLEKESQENISNNEAEFIKIRKDITVLKGQVGALDDDLKKLSSA